MMSHQTALVQGVGEAEAGEMLMVLMVLLLMRVAGHHIITPGKQRQTLTLESLTHPDSPPKLHLWSPIPSHHQHHDTRGDICTFFRHPSTQTLMCKHNTSPRRSLKNTSAHCFSCLCAASQISVTFGGQKAFFRCHSHLRSCPETDSHSVQTCTSAIRRRMR